MSSRRTALVVPAAEKLLRAEMKERVAALEFLAKTIAGARF